MTNKLKQILIFAVLFGLFVYSTLRTRAEKEVIERVRRQASAASALLPHRYMKLEEFQLYAARLRQVDTTGAPAHVRQAFSNLLAAVEQHEANLKVTAVSDTNRVWNVEDRQKEFWEAVGKRRFRLF